MKNKLFKIMIISLLCLVVFAGCAVVPTPDATPEVTPTLTPDATPTPVPPTPTSSPIPYGEVLDLNVCLLADRISDLYPVSYFSEILLEKFSLKIKIVSSVKEADFVYDTRASQQTDRDYINILEEYGDRMPHYKALFENNDMYHVWMYNEEWFEKNGYSIPGTMDELVSILVEHKKTHPDEKPIFEPKLKNGKSLYNEFGLTRAEIAIGLTYGIDMNKSMSSKNEKYKAYTHAKKIINTVRENNLIDRKEITYN